MPDERSPSELREQLRRKPDFWRSRSLRFMFLVTVIGLALWVYALATAAPAPPPASADVSAMAAGAAAPPSNRTRLIDESAPATFRLGFSFVVGFFVAYVFRRFIKMLLLVGGGIATLLIILKATGFLNIDMTSVQSEVDRGIDAAQEHAFRFKDLILGYVPSGVSAGAGVLAGARRRS